MLWFKSKKRLPAEPASDAKPRGLFHRLAREWIVPVLLVMVVMAPIRSVIADWNDVPSGSMRPTILEGDRIYVNKLAFGLRVPFTHTWLARWDEPRRGDIATFASPADGIRLVKRVVGIPGDTIELRNNQLVINGVAADLNITCTSKATLPGGREVPIELARETISGVEHAITITPSCATHATFGPIVVPEGMYFMMGDNRDLSNDSRFIGMVPLESFYGRCSGVALSLDPEDGYWPRWNRWCSGLR
jgi:signal peptidase I